MDRREFVKTSALTAAAVSLSKFAFAADDFAPIWAEIQKRHDEAVQRLQSWIRQPSIAAEDRFNQGGAELLAKMLKEAGFQSAVTVPTDRHPGVFATLDAGAPKTYGVYFMYDVKQGDGEWSSPPFEANIVERPGLGKVLIGRGAVNQKGPESAFIAALHAIHGAGRKLPINLVLVAEGEEEIGSPHFPQVVRKPEVMAALKKCVGIFMPNASQNLDGSILVTLGAKGVVELELTSSGERWGRGPGKDVHSSNKARLDSPVWHLVQALNTLVGSDGNSIAVEGYTAKVRSVSAHEKQMIADAAKRMDEAVVKKGMAVQRWMKDATFEQSIEMLVSQPTINIEGLVGGYTGPGGKTVLPHKAIAKLDLRLVPDMTAQEAVASIKAHLAKKGFGDIEVTMGGGYDPNSTPENAEIIQREIAVYKRHGVDPILLPRNAGSWPGYVFTGEPLRLPAGHFGLGHGSGAHAPDEYYVIESTNQNVQGYDGAVRLYVEYLYELAK